MTAYEAYQLSHEFLAEVHGSCGFVYAACLYHVPVMYQTHHIVIPADVAFQYLSRTWIMHVGSIGILDGACQITYAAVPCIFHAHGGIVLGPFLSYDGILESCFLKGLLPVIDTLYQILAPLFRSGRVYVVYYRLHGFHQFAPSHLLHILGPWFQSPSCDEFLAFHSLLLISETGIAVSKEAYSRVVIALHHGLFG